MQWVKITHGGASILVKTTSSRILSSRTVCITCPNLLLFSLHLNGFHEQNCNGHEIVENIVCYTSLDINRTRDVRIGNLNAFKLDVSPMRWCQIFLSHLYNHLWLFSSRWLGNLWLHQCQDVMTWFHNTFIVTVVNLIAEFYDWLTHCSVYLGNTSSVSVLDAKFRLIKVFAWNFSYVRKITCGEQRSGIVCNYSI
jgi:hypothetical protein